jgi:hypothetical protein
VVGFVVAFYFPHLFVFSQKLHPYVVRIWFASFLWNFCLTSTLRRHWKIVISEPLLQSILEELCNIRTSVAVNKREASHWVGKLLDVSWCCSDFTFYLIRLLGVSHWIYQVKRESIDSEFILWFWRIWMLTS